MLPHAAVDWFVFGDFAEDALVGRTLDRFVRAEREKSEANEAVDEQIVHAKLQRFVELRQNSARNDQVKLIHGLVADQAVLRKDEVLSHLVADDERALPDFGRFGKRERRTRCVMCGFDRFGRFNSKTPRLAAATAISLASVA